MTFVIKIDKLFEINRAELLFTNDKCTMYSIELIAAKMGFVFEDIANIENDNPVYSSRCYVKSEKNKQLYIWQTTVDFSICVQIRFLSSMQSVLEYI